MFNCCRAARCIALIGAFAPLALTAESKVIAPIRLNRESIAGLEIPAIPWAEKDRLGHELKLYASDEISVSVFESTPKDPRHPNPTVTDIRIDYPWDQFVMVLSGKAVLTDTAGHAQTFVTGDAFVVPRGFKGSWADYGVYRELIVVWGTAAKTREFKLND
jgi:hypothetical protein